MPKRDTSRRDRRRADDSAPLSRSSERPFNSDAAIARGRSLSNGDQHEYYDVDIEQGRHAQQPRGHGHSIAGRGGGGDTSRHGGNSGRSPTLSPDRSSARADQPLSHEMSREMSSRTSAMAEQEPLPVRTMASLVRQSQAVNKAADSMRHSARIDEGVPKVAFVRVNIMDVLEYDDKKKQASVKLYLEVAWRKKDAERHHLEKKPKEEEVKWTNADEKTTNDVPDEFWQQACPFSFSKTHPVSDLLDNYIPSVDTETWNSWFQLDHTAEEKFEKMEPNSAPLDPNGKLQPVRSALHTAQREPASHSASAYMLCISIVSLY